MQYISTGRTIGIIVVGTAKVNGRVASGKAVSQPVDDRVADFLLTVGEQVRAARGRKGISRRVLSENSGVSQRYLAQLESGQGNISIGLLLRIADALDLGLEWLVSADDTWDPEVAKTLRLLRGATRSQRERVLKILEPERPSPDRTGRIALIGLRGAGKSTLGRLAASRLGLRFLELNHEVEAVAGMPVDEVIALYGQEGYRLLERQALDRIAKQAEPLILAVAGGIVAHPDSFDHLLRYYHTIWLKAAPEDHMRRVRAQGDERPMAGTPDAMNELRNILTSREVLYSQADAMVNTSRTSVEDSLRDLLDVIDRRGFLASLAGADAPAS
jgi:XRE family aerobic/anaerobic benzoate catabolism transcriptional regulator